LSENESNGETWNGLGHYLAVVWKYKWLVLAFGALIVTATVVFTQRQPRIYEAVTHLMIDPNAPQYLPTGSGQEVSPLGTANTWNTREYFETQYRIIRSRSVAAMVVERLGLARDLDFLGIREIEDPTEQAAALASADPISTLVGRLQVEPVESSNVVLVKVRDQNPERAARLADAISRAYGDANLDRKISFTGDAARWLTEQVNGGRKEIEAGEDELMQFKQKHGILTASLADKQNQLAARALDADSQLREARQETTRLSSALDQIKRLNAADAESSVDEVLANGLVQRLKEQLVSLQNERTGLAQRYLDGHPDVQTADQKITRVRDALTREVQGIKQSMERRLQTASSAEQKLAADAASIQREMQALNAAELEYKRLDAAIQSRKDLHTQLMVRQKEAQLQAEARANNVRILDAAMVPERPVSPRIFLNLSVALLVAFFAGIGLALLIDSLDSSVKNQEQLEKELGLTFLGLVPTIRPQRGKKVNRFEPTGPVDPDRYVLDYPHSTAAECVRTVRTNLLFMAPERELRKLLITSAGPREGKTSTSVNIAATMAMSGSRVLLIDSDLRRPRIHRIFDLENNRGLSNLVLEPERDLATVAQPSGVENLDILCSGPIPPNPAELLHTASFHRVVERLLERYDRIIFDSPPVCAVTDALILGNVCDGAVLVVRAGETSREMVKKARRLLADVKVNILGALLNNVDVSKRGYGHYYYQDYRPTSYYPDEQRPAESGTGPQS